MINGIWSIEAGDKCTSVNHSITSALLDDPNILLMSKGVVVQSVSLPFQTGPTKQLVPARHIARIVRGPSIDTDGGCNVM